MDLFFFSQDWAFFAVFDGHAGAKISAHCSEHLLNSITSGEEFLVRKILLSLAMLLKDFSIIDVLL